MTLWDDYEHVEDTVMFKGEETSEWIEADNAVDLGRENGRIEDPESAAAFVEADANSVVDPVEMR